MKQKPKTKLPHRPLVSRELMEYGDAVRDRLAQTLKNLAVSLEISRQLHEYGMDDLFDESGNR